MYERKHIMDLIDYEIKLLGSDGKHMVNASERPKCLLCGGSVAVAAIFVPDPGEWDAPEGTWLVVQYGLCVDFVKIEQPLLAELAECFLMAMRGAWCCREVGGMVS
jgi:hypothetical protein